MFIHFSDGALHTSAGLGPHLFQNIAERLGNLPFEELVILFLPTRRHKFADVPVDLPQLDDSLHFAYVPEPP